MSRRRCANGIAALPRRARIRRNAHWLRIGVLVSALSACVAAPPLPETPPLGETFYTLDEAGRFLALMELNDRGRHPFIVDTGASMTVLFESTARRLGIERDGATVIVRDAISAGSFPTARLQRLALGDLESLDHRVVIVPDWDDVEDAPAGILGVDFLRHYSIRLDADGRRMMLYPPDFFAGANYRGWITVPLERRRLNDQNEFFYVRGAVNGYPVDGIFDLGAEGTLMSWATANRMNISRNDPLVRRDLRIRGALEATDPSFRFTAAYLKLGDAIWLQEAVTIIDLPIYRYLGLAPNSAVIFGSNLFSERDLIVDFDEPRLLIRRENQSIDLDALCLDNYGRERRLCVTTTQGRLRQRYN
ncbi:MAG: hypothetical protein Tsb0010_13980 [Parvularculaceae bacterium]